MTDDLDGSPAGDMAGDPAGSRPVRRTTLPTTSQRLAQLGRDLEELAGPAAPPALPARRPAAGPAGMPAAELLGRCWPAVLSVNTVETVLVDECLRDAPGPVVRRHRQATRGLQAAIELKARLRGPLRAIATDPAAGDAVRRAAALAETALRLART